MDTITHDQTSPTLADMVKDPRVREHLRKTAGHLSDIPEEMFLPPSRPMRERQVNAHVMRLYFQGNQEGPSLPIWGGLTDFYFHCLDLHLEFPENLTRDSAGALRWDKLLKSVGIPNGRVFRRMLGLYDKQLVGCSVYASDDPWTRSQARAYISQAATSLYGQRETVERSNARIIEFLLDISGISNDSALEAELVRRRWLPNVIAREFSQTAERFKSGYSGPLSPARGHPVKPVDEKERLLLWAYWKTRTGQSQPKDFKSLLGQNQNTAGNISKLFRKIDERLLNCPTQIGYDEAHVHNDGPDWMLWSGDVVRIAMQHWRELGRAGTQFNSPQFNRISNQIW